MRCYWLLGGIAVFTIALDQFTKWEINRTIPLNSQISVIPGFFDLVNIRNRGAAFGFLNRSDIEWQFWLFVLATLIALAAIFYLARGAKNQPVFCAGLALILGGALGNLIDRLRFHSVVDFLDFYWKTWHWPAFNVADMAICIGTFIVCVALWKQPHKKLPT